MRGTHATLYFKQVQRTTKTSTTLCRTLYISLLFVMDGSSVRSHIHTEFTRRPLDSSPTPCLVSCLPLSARRCLLLSAGRECNWGWSAWSGHSILIPSYIHQYTKHTPLIVGSDSGLVRPCSEGALHRRAPELPNNNVMHLGSFNKDAFKSSLNDQ